MIYLGGKNYSFGIVWHIILDYTNDHKGGAPTPWKTITRIFNVNSIMVWRNPPPLAYSWNHCLVLIGIENREKKQKMA